MQVKYTLIKRDERTRARAGIVETSHGTISTPVFMPVGTQATVKTISPEELKDLGAEIVLGNTYHLYLQPGEEIVKEAGGLGTKSKPRKKSIQLGPLMKCDLLLEQLPSEGAIHRPGIETVKAERAR